MGHVIARTARTKILVKARVKKIVAKMELAKLLKIF